ncbi:hypothetical protein SBRY_11232 [Actinacidiphila bryophytorum]|uniref:Uncharacterized protein n=1 Tax=Actinacidiphila bryophytorum TaxID=1436133 RepID=A0A9W4E1T8_9ACTN|nr:hypothetical protein SBRY_11232 [Actinacidiphila bryophytorum]
MVHTPACVRRRTPVRTAGRAPAPRASRTPFRCCRDSRMLPIVNTMTPPTDRRRDGYAPARPRATGMCQVNRLESQPSSFEGVANGGVSPPVVAGRVMLGLLSVREFMAVNRSHPAHVPQAPPSGPWPPDRPPTLSATGGQDPRDPGNHWVDGSSETGMGA